MGHIVLCLHLLKERICFLHMYPELSFQVWFVSFYFSPPPKFSLKLFLPKLVLFFPIFIGGEACFYPLLLFIGGVVSIFYRVELFCVSLILYFLLTFVAFVVYLLFVWVIFVNTWQKGGDLFEIWEYVWKIQECSV